MRPPPITVDEPREGREPRVRDDGYADDKEEERGGVEAEPVADGGHEEDGRSRLESDTARHALHPGTFGAFREIPSLGSGGFRDEGRAMGEVAATWLGHAAFRFDSPGGTRIYLDPWLANPNCPDEERNPERVDVIALTHGHDDHVGETVELSKRFSPAIVAMVELRAYLGRQGVEGDSTTTFNKGGTVEAGGVGFTMTDAKHSSSCPDGEYGGEAAGFVIAFEDGTKVYVAGDTCVFGDMALIGRLYSPDVAILPIGGHYTMDPEQAALALELLGVKRCVPCHYGTFPLLAGTPEELRGAAPGVEVIAPEPGETVTL